MGFGRRPGDCLILSGGRRRGRRTLPTVAGPVPPPAALCDDRMPDAVTGHSEMTAIVLVHAFGSSGRAWTPQVEGLGDAHRVQAPDLPGHGGSAAPFTLAAAVETVRGALDEAGRAAHLVGISGGSVVALLTCLRHPALVDRLVLSGGLAHPPRWFPLQRAMASVAPEPLLARAYRGAYAGGRPERERAAEEDFLACGKPNFLAGLREIAGLDLRPRLGEVATPTLVLCGSRDRANLPLSRELAAGIPAAELRVIPGAAHLWNLQLPDLFNRTLAEFLDRGAAGGDSHDTRDGG